MTQVNRYSIKVFKPRVSAYCQKCRPRLKVCGDLLMACDHPVRAIDGNEAYKLFFKCRNASHIRPVGFTRPVDFEKNFQEYGHETGYLQL